MEPALAERSRRRSTTSGLVPIARRALRPCARNARKPDLHHALACGPRRERVAAGGRAPGVRRRRGSAGASGANFLVVCAPASISGWRASRFCARAVAETMASISRR